MGALVLTRYPGQDIMIGDDIIVTVVSTNGNQVRMRIEAPNEVEIDRAEIRERKVKEGRYGPEPV